MDYSYIPSLRRKANSLHDKYNEKYNCIDKETGCYKNDLIPGLCPKKCSCLQCREARKSDKMYMQYVSFNRALYNLLSRISVKSDLESRVLNQNQKTRDMIYSTLQKDFEALYMDICNRFGL